MSYSNSRGTPFGGGYFISDFIEIQRRSFFQLLEKGLIDEFSKRNPITSKSNEMELYFYPEYYKLVSPKYNPRQAILKSKSYTSKLYMPAQLTYKKTNTVRLKWVYIGNIPLMTKRGHFILNGAARVIVNQIIRSPGIYYQEKIKEIFTDKWSPKPLVTYKRHYADLICLRGTWLRLEVDKEKLIWAQTKKGPKIPILWFLIAMGLNEFVIFNSVLDVNRLFHSSTIIKNWGQEERYINIDSRQKKKERYLYKYQNEPISAWEQIYSLVKSKQKSTRGNIKSGNQNLSEQGRKWLFNKFMNPRTYDLGKQGRLAFNKKLGLQIDENQLTLTPLDLLYATDYLIKVEKGIYDIDDIDHLKNRRVRTSGELIQIQIGVAIVRLEKSIREKMNRAAVQYFHFHSDLKLKKKKSTGPTAKLELTNSLKWPDINNTPNPPSFGLNPLNRTYPTGSPLSLWGSPGASIAGQDGWKWGSQGEEGTKEGSLTPVEDLGNSNTINSPNPDSPDSPDSFDSPLNLKGGLKNGLAVGRGLAGGTFKKSISGVIPTGDDITKEPSHKLGRKQDGRTAKVKKIEFKKLKMNYLIDNKPFNSALREFFGTSPLSQFMDQINPLAELTHKRRLSSMGPGGVTRDSATLDIRGIHPTHYGRICPVETPEGKNTGLVNSLTTYSRVNPFGILESPFYKVYKGIVQKKAGKFFLSAEQEEKIKLAAGDLFVNSLGFLPNANIPVRIADNFTKINRNNIEYIGVSPIQMISIATSLIPFLEHDDANRALMGSNMQRQAVPLMKPERPIVGTGLESRAVSDSGHAIQSKFSGVVTYVSAEKIIVTTLKND